MREGRFITNYEEERQELERQDEGWRLDEERAQDAARYPVQTWRLQHIPAGCRIQEYFDYTVPEFGICGTVLGWGFDGSSREPAYLVAMDNGERWMLPDDAIMPLSMVMM